MSRNPTRASPLHPPLQLLDCLAYLNVKEIEFAGKELYYFGILFLAAMQCNSVEDLTFFCLVWIDNDDFTWSSALFTVSLTLVMRIGATMARSSTGTIGDNEICRLLCIIMTFPLPISKELREFLHFNPVEDALSDEEPPSDPESSSTSFTGSSAYGGDKMSSMLHFVDKDVLAYVTWLDIQREAADVENA